mgnify:CR=1 FL=1
MEKDESYLTRRQFLGAITSGVVLAAAGNVGNRLSTEVENKKEYNRIHDFDHIFKTDFEITNPELTFESACDITPKREKAGFNKGASFPY